MDPKVKEVNPHSKSRGTQVAAKLREESNNLTDSERNELMGLAMQLIYKGRATSQVGANCR